jgi:hypothetical protein
MVLFWFPCPLSAIAPRMLSPVIQHAHIHSTANFTADGSQPPLVTTRSPNRLSLIALCFVC